MDGGVRLTAGCAGKGWLHWHASGLVLWLWGCSASQEGWWHCPARGGVDSLALPLRWARITVREGSRPRQGGTCSALLTSRWCGSVGWGGTWSWQGNILRNEREYFENIFKLGRVLLGANSCTAVL